MNCCKNPDLIFGEYPEEIPEGKIAMYCLNCKSYTLTDFKKYVIFKETKKQAWEKHVEFLKRKKRYGEDYSIPPLNIFHSEVRISEIDEYGHVINEFYFCNQDDFEEFKQLITSTEFPEDLELRGKIARINEQITRIDEKLQEK